MGRKYQKPPIIEAVCEFRFEPSSPWDLTVPGLVYEKLRNNGFPKRIPVTDVEVDNTQSEGRIRQEFKTVDRVRFSREDAKAFIQVGPNRLSIHHLKPYPSWEKFEPLIGKGFDAYFGAASPKSIQRIGLRYINRIEIEGTEVELENYFGFYPFVGDKLPQKFGPFIVGIEIPHENSRDMLRLLLTNVVTSSPNTSGAVLDLDYFLAKPNEVALEKVFEWIDFAHNKVEEVFEACIRDPLRVIFGEEK
jgi:uncharacterized protein (TIGR04255 family)